MLVSLDTRGPGTLRREWATTSGTTNWSNSFGRRGCCTVRSLHTSGSLNGHNARANVNLHCMRKFESVLSPLYITKTGSQCSKNHRDRHQKHLSCQRSPAEAGASLVPIPTLPTPRCMPVPPSRFPPPSTSEQSDDARGKSNAHHSRGWAAVPRSKCTAS